jgi:acyl-CoA synthetase (AMP-forming)/AMP-acid ligase II/thioesterase domain-containing protein
MPVETLQALLEHAADSQPRNGIIAYPLGNTEFGKTLNYTRLRSQAQFNAQLLSGIPGFSRGSVILVHFNDHLDNIIWFWSVLYAGCVPAMSTPFTHSPAHREKHILHLHKLLCDPLCITNLGLLDEFAGQDVLRVHAVESLGLLGDHITENSHAFTTIPSTDLALLMLTSGSTGSAKAVCLAHEQILASVAGKASAVQLPAGHVFLNWIGLDHVAGMVEIHLHAMYLGIDQVHVQTNDIISNSLTFLNLISRHRVTRSFAPNFFLANLKRSLDAGHGGLMDQDLDLSCLRFIASGGEANVVETCDAVSKILSKYGAPRNVIVPGFGMTETCAGAIYNDLCPDYDLQNRYEFASLGSCIAGINMRVNLPSADGKPAAFNEPGDLEVSGPIVFKGYYNNPAATAEAFTDDGWFRTGDQAVLDSAGKLNLLGRTKETMNINGVKHNPHELEAALEEASISGAVSSYYVCFSYRQAGRQTEELCVVYLPAYTPEDIEARVHTLNAIVQTVMLQISVRPYVLPLDTSQLSKSTLGKLSRSKIRAALERGDYKAYQEVNDESIKSWRASSYSEPANDMEMLLLAELEASLELPAREVGVTTSVFEMGVTSIDLIKLKRRIEVRLGLKAEIPMVTMMTNPTARSLAAALKDLDGPQEYDPVVVLQHRGSKTPLWLIHPGVGEVLVFLGLAKHINERPVYALRARGFEQDQSHFQSIDEAVTTYHAAIKARQPEGPYAIAGYSYGTMLAFETAKVLERHGDEVRFLGSFNLPPHIKFRMQQLSWTQCLLHLSYFLELITEEHAIEIAAEMQQRSKEEAVAHLVKVATPARMAELALTAEALADWAALAYGLQSMAREYEPSGSVATMDVFCALPLAAVAKSKEEWLQGHLSRWADFCRTEPRFHDVDGAHYTMIGPDYVYTFQRKLKMVLKSRNL